MQFCAVYLLSINEQFQIKSNQTQFSLSLLFQLKSEQPLSEPVGVKHKSEEESEPPAPVTKIADEPLLLKKEEDEKEEKEREKGKTEAEIIKDLKIQLK